MERKILFRGKRVDNGEWVKGSLNQFNRKTYILPDKEIDDDSKFGAYHIKKQISYEVIPETVGQFTGLTDKNGVEIFEEDVVKIDAKSIYKERVSIVEWVDKVTDGSWMSCVGKWHIETAQIYTEKNIEVIGNIHDNAELL